MRASAWGVGGDRGQVGLSSQKLGGPAAAEVAEASSENSTLPAAMVLPKIVVARLRWREWPDTRPVAVHRCQAACAVYIDLVRTYAGPSIRWVAYILQGRGEVPPHWG